MKPSRTLLAIVPLFNEAPALIEFHASLLRQEEAIQPEGWHFQVLYVDDGSTDNTAEILRDLARSDARVSFLQLARNFGHQAALCAGIDRANPNVDAAVILDGDGQHPVDLIPEMLRLHMGGIDVVRTARIDDENAGSSLKRWISRQFHELWSHLSETSVPAGTTEFALFGGPVLGALKRFPESHRYLRGLLSFVGFSSITLPVRMRQRAHGATNYSLRKQIRLASDGVFSFSTLPLRLCLVPGIVFVLAAMVEVVAIVWQLIHGYPIAAGWTSLMIIMLLGFGCTMLVLAIAGLYIGKIFEQVKHRPIYLLRADSDSASLRPDVSGDARPAVAASTSRKSPA